MKHYLVIRLSSMGDVALTVPVLQAVCNQNDDVHCTIVTRGQFNDMFFANPNLTFFTADIKGRHKGFSGAYRLFRALQKEQQFDAIIDLHHVFRSSILTNLFKWQGIPVFKLDKGRSEKKKATTKNHPPISKLKHTTERYADVFRRAGLKVDLNQYQPINPPKTKVINDYLDNLNSPIIGIAPFAQHAQKMLPIKKTKALINALVQKGYSIILFGGGKSEQEQAENLQAQFPNQVHSIIGQFSLLEEMALMKSVEAMITMDSSNMHLARLVGTKVISVWGATHPSLGFSPFLQENDELNIQIPVEALPCRPCSVYGNKVCHRGDWACLNGIDIQNIMAQIES